MTNRLRELLLVTIAILALSGCKKDNHQTSHPDEGGIRLSVDWSNAGTDIPQSYQARIISSSGITQDFPNLSGSANDIVVDPGDAMMYVYNTAQDITLFGKKATVAGVGAGIAANPGWFYCYSTEIHTERDRDIAKTALMIQQTKELKISLAIKPASKIDQVKTIKAVLEGVASELDMQTNALSGVSIVFVIFDKGSFYHTTSMRLLGIEPSTEQNLKLNIEFENGYMVNVVNNLSSLMEGFNIAKNVPLSLVADLQISDGNNPSVKIDQWKIGAGDQYLSVYPTDIEWPYTVSSESIIVTTDQPSWVYNVSQTGNWLSVTKANNRLNISAAGNTGDERQATILVSASGLSETVTVTQNANNINGYQDKEVIKLQTATVGKGVNIVMMGDGYTVKDMTKGSGKYEQDMRTATEHFFSVYPYTEYRDHFNVYMVVAVSNQEGISNKSTNTNVDTKFKTVWEGGHSTRITYNSENVFEYLYPFAETAHLNLNKDINDLTVIIPINEYVYAGTCYMSIYNQISDPGFGEGFSVCLCPVGSSFKKIVVHEAGGHGFSKVTDEYYIDYHDTETIPDGEKEEIIDFKQFGWCVNVDFYENIMQTNWKGFANNPKYSMVSTFEGAQGYGYGIWRPEFNSCMNDNVLYFNAPTRWAQVRRIKKLAGFAYSFSQFLQDDVVPQYPSSLKRTDAQTPLAPPVMRIINRSF